jgi:2,4-dienoyl-CoA reductase-like NADH-dependent reductase (Old Yellow Enzyme family)
MADLFYKTAVKSLTMNNRFIRSATWLAMGAEDGSCTPQLVEAYARLAEGEIGLIIAGFSFVSPEGKGPQGMTGLHDDATAETFRDQVEAVHAGGGRISAQLAHCGARSSPLFGAGEALGPSEVLKENGDVAVRELDRDGIARIVADFAAAAARARSVGFDAVQLHFAHGYLGSQFLSPYYNRRTDDYGGTIENRLRFLLEVYGAVRNELGDSYPIMAKLNSADYVDGGLTLDEGVAAAVRLAEAGIDLIEVSGGTADSGRLGPARAVKSETDEAYLRENALAVKSAAGVPVAVVGGIRRLEQARSLVQADNLDYVSLSRPFLREPGLVARWKSGDGAPALCESCSRCFRTQVRGRGIFCDPPRRKVKGD